MDSRQANKKLRLSSGSSKNYFSDLYHSPGLSNKHLSNDDELWGDDLAVDDDLIQKIETQGYSQYQNNDVLKTNHEFGAGHQTSTVATSDPSRILDSQTNLQLELQMKSGEVKNLRMEMENKTKEFCSMICEKEAVIEDLRKQLSGKQSEIEFQKIEKMSQICRTPKSSAPKLSNSSVTAFKSPQNVNNSFHERFTFGSSKHTIKDRKVFNFSRPLHKGDVLFKLLQSTVSSKKKNIEVLAENSDHPSNHKNEFSVNLETNLLELCRCISFDQPDAHSLLMLVFTKSRELLFRFHTKLSRKEINQEICSRKSKIITLPKIKDTSVYINEQSLLMNTKLSDTEKGIPARQTITMLAKLILIEPKVANMLIEPDREPIAGCTCSNSKKILNMSNLFNSSLQFSSTKSVKLDASRKDEEMETDDHFQRDIPNKKILVFDIVELAHDIVQEITVRGKSSKYEGVFSSIIHLYSVLCDCDVNIYEKQFELIISSIKKILFNLPGFVVVQYIIEFLSSSARFSFFNALCCRSAAETFTENFRYFSFTKETCILQVICAYIEMMKKTPKFIFSFVLWVSSLTSTTHSVNWLSNKTDSKFCECLLMLEQITIRIMLSCVDQYNSSRTVSEKRQFKSLLRRCACIFQQFRWKDTDFDLHISTCRGEYRMLLQYVRDIVDDDDDVTKKFIAQELELTNVSQKYDLMSNIKNEVIESMLKVFSEDSL